MKSEDMIIINGKLLDEDQATILKEAVNSAFNDGLLSKHYTREVLDYNEDEQKDLLSQVLNYFI